MKQKFPHMASPETLRMTYLNRRTRLLSIYWYSKKGYGRKGIPDFFKNPVSYSLQPEKRD
jgi:predicted phosphoadenosine phosphosulfate sulfurtransferase